MNRCGASSGLRASSSPTAQVRGALQHPVRARGWLEERTEADVPCKAPQCSAKHAVCARLPHTFPTPPILYFVSAAAINSMIKPLPAGLGFQAYRREASAKALQAGTGGGMARGWVWGGQPRAVAICSRSQDRLVHHVRRRRACHLLLPLLCAWPADMVCHDFQTLEPEDVSRADLDTAARRVLTARIRCARPPHWASDGGLQGPRFHGTWSQLSPCAAACRSARCCCCCAWLPP